MRAGGRRVTARRLRVRCAGSPASAGARARRAPAPTARRLVPTPRPPKKAPRRPKLRRILKITALAAPAAHPPRPAGRLPLRQVGVRQDREDPAGRRAERRRHRHQLPHRRLRLARPRRPRGRRAGPGRVRRRRRPAVRHDAGAPVRGRQGDDDVHPTRPLRADRRDRRVAEDQRRLQRRPEPADPHRAAVARHPDQPLPRGRLRELRQARRLARGHHDRLPQPRLRPGLRPRRPRGRRGGAGRCPGARVRPLPPLRGGDRRRGGARRHRRPRPGAAPAAVPQGRVQRARQREEPDHPRPGGGERVPAGSASTTP